MVLFVSVLALLLLSCLASSVQQQDAETDSLPLTPPIASAEVVDQDGTTCPSVEAQNLVKDTLQPLVLSITDTVAPCTPRLKGLVPHCPASNCTELFNLAQEEGLILLSNYYWLVGTTGEVRKVYCNRNTQQPEYTSCDQLFELFNPPSGTYTIYPSRGNPVTVYCDMDMEECGGGGWIRVVSDDYNDPNVSCPDALVKRIDPVGCALPVLGCPSSFFSTPVEFSQVCGKVIALQDRTPIAFNGPDNIDGVYVRGVSITHGSPRQHIWSFAVYPFASDTTVSNICPCSQPSLDVPPPPSFVGDNYFCDTASESAPTGFVPNNPLWDGQGCSSPSTCCSFNNPPWFSTTLPQHTTDDIEMRLCHILGGGNSAITQLDLFIK